VSILEGLANELSETLKKEVQEDEVKVEAKKSIALYKGNEKSSSDRKRDKERREKDSKSRDKDRDRHRDKDRDRKQRLFAWSPGMDTIVSVHWRLNHLSVILKPRRMKLLIVHLG